MAKIILEIDGVRYVRMAASSVDCEHCDIHSYCMINCTGLPCSDLGTTRAIFKKEGSDETE